MNGDYNTVQSDQNIVIAFRNGDISSLIMLFLFFFTKDIFFFYLGKLRVICILFKLPLLFALLPCEAEVSVSQPTLKAQFEV